MVDRPAQFAHHLIGGPMQLEDAVHLGQGIVRASLGRHEPAVLLLEVEDLAWADAHPFTQRFRNRHLTLFGYHTLHTATVMFPTPRVNVERSNTARQAGRLPTAIEERYSRNVRLRWCRDEATVRA